MTSQAEDLAGRINEARKSRVALDAHDEVWASIDRGLALDIAAELYQLWGATASTMWKLGAVDAATQNRLGLDGPVCAPVSNERAEIDCHHVTIEAADFIEAKFEAEVGVVVDDHMRVAACVEVADSRFIGWQLPPHGVIADGCLQSMLIFGESAPAPDVVRVTVTHNGREVARGVQSVTEVMSRLGVLPDGSGATHVATGAITELLSVVVGEWCFDFESLGRVTVVVT